MTIMWGRGYGSRSSPPSPAGAVIERGRERREGEEKGSGELSIFKFAVCFSVLLQKL